MSCFSQILFVTFGFLSSFGSQFRQRYIARFPFSSPLSRVMESEWDMANAWLKWTFSLSNPMLEEGMRKPLTLEKFLHLPKAMRTDTSSSKLRGERHRPYCSASSTHMIYYRGLQGREVYVLRAETYGSHELR